MASARHPQLLLAGGIELCASSVIAGTWRKQPQAHRSAAARCVPADHGSCVVQPTWLSISLMNCADLGGRRLGLLALDADQRRLVLAIGEPDFEQSRWTAERRTTTATNSATYLREQPAADLCRPTGAAAGAAPPTDGAPPASAALGRVGMEGNAHPGQASKNKPGLSLAAMRGEDPVSESTAAVGAPPPAVASRVALSAVRAEIEIGDLLVRCRAGLGTGGRSAQPDIDRRAARTA